MNTEIGLENTKNVDPQKSLWIFIAWCNREKTLVKQIIEKIVRYVPYEFKDDDGALWTRDTVTLYVKQHWWSRRTSDGSPGFLVSNFPACPTCKLPCMERECHIDHATFVCPMHGKGMYW